MVCHLEAVDVGRVLGNGAVLDFRTSGPELIQALHSWGVARISDHGGHAETSK